MSENLTFIELRQIKQEVHFHCKTWKKLSDDDRNQSIVEMDQWTQDNLRHHVEPDWGRAKPKRAKDEIRRWLNKNCDGRWSFTVAGVSFESDRDATLFRIWYG